MKKKEIFNGQFIEVLNLFVFLVLIPLSILLFSIVLVNEVMFYMGLTSSKITIPICANNTFVNIDIEYKFNGGQYKGTMEYKSLLRAELYEILNRKMKEDTISNLIKHKDRTIMEISNEITEPNIEILDIRINN